MKKLLVVIIICASTIPSVIYAAEFIPLISFPGVSNLSLEGYLDWIYTLAISLAAFLAVAKIILAGIQYFASDVVTNKQDAKSNIKGALLGILIIVAAITLLNEINPNLTNLNLFDSKFQVQLPPSFVPSTPPVLPDEYGYCLIQQSQNKKLVYISLPDGSRECCVPGDTCSIDPTETTIGAGVNTVTIVDKDYNATDIRGLIQELKDKGHEVSLTGIGKQKIADYDDPALDLKTKYEAQCQKNLGTSAKLIKLRKQTVAGTPPTEYHFLCVNTK